MLSFSIFKTQTTRIEMSFKATIEKLSSLDKMNTDIHFRLHNLNMLIENLKKIDAQSQYEILKGAHTKLDDDGVLYNLIAQIFKSNESNGTIYKRISSHYKSEKSQQYGLKIPPEIEEMLIGITTVHGERKTWIQMERHSLRSFTSMIKHLIDYLVHKITGYNVGPMGLSKYTEHDPLRINLKNNEIVPF